MVGEGENTWEKAGEGGGRWEKAGERGGRWEIWGGSREGGRRPGRVVVGPRRWQCDDVLGRGKRWRGARRMRDAMRLSPCRAIQAGCSGAAHSDEGRPAT